MSKHTPVPWSFDGRGRGKILAEVGKAGYRGQGFPIAELCLDDEFAEENAANGHLMAAAPHLLSVCREHAEGLARDLRLSEDPLHPLCRETLANRVQALRAAIAKAEGGGQ